MDSGNSVDFWEYGLFCGKVCGFLGKWHVFPQSPCTGAKSIDFWSFLWIPESFPKYMDFSVTHLIYPEIHKYALFHKPCHFPRHPQTFPLSMAFSQQSVDFSHVHGVFHMPPRSIIFSLNLKWKHFSLKPFYLHVFSTPTYIWNMINIYSLSVVEQPWVICKLI